MAERLAYLEAVVGADITQFRKGMRDIRNEFGFLSETVQGLAGMGRSLTFAFTVPVIALGTAAINTASEFDAAMRNINSIAQVTEGELAALSQMTLEFGATTRGGSITAANSLYSVFSAGLTDTAQAFSTMQVATYTAEAGLADMTTTTETLVAIMLSYGDTTEEMAWRASDALTRMVQIGVGSMQEFSSSVGKVIPTAAAAGVSIEELFGNMAFLTQRGITASNAGISMNAMLSQLINPTEAMSAAFAELNASNFTDLVDEFGSANAAIAAIIETTDGDLTSLFKMFNSIQSRRAVVQFANNMEDWQASLDEFNADVAGSTMRAWEQQMMSFAASWDLLISAVQGAGIAIGSALLPVLTPLVQGLADLVNMVTTADPEIIQLGVAFVAVAAAIPPLIWLTMSLITPFGVLVTAVGALAAAFVTNWNGIQDTVKTAVANILGDLTPLTNEIQNFWNRLFPSDPTAGVQEALEPSGTINPMRNISVDRPMSLWEIYESQGYSEMFSWNEFIAAATAGGWDGGALTPDTPLTVELPVEFAGNPIVDAADQIMTTSDILRDIEIGIAPEQVDLSFVDRLADGFRSVWPRIQTELGTIWSSITGWFDEKVGSGITWVANLFTAGAGSQELYTAFVSLLEGDLIGAIDAIFPTAGTNIGTAIGGWGEDIKNALPQVSAGLNTLFTNMGSWLLSTGVPLLAQSAGYLSGKIAVMLFDAVNAAIQFFSSGGASDAAGTIGQYVDEGIVTPFTQGFEDATAGTAFSGFTEMLSTAFDSFTTELETKITSFGETVSNLATMLDIPEGWNGLTSLGEGIGDFFTHIADADWTGILKLVGFVGVLGGAVFKGAMGFIEGIGAGAGNAISALGAGIGDFADFVSLALSGDLQGALVSLGLTLFNLSFALLQIPVGILDGVLNIIQDLMGFEIGDLSDWLEQVRAWVNGEGSEPIAFDPEVEVAPIYTFRFAWEGSGVIGMQESLDAGLSEELEGLGTIVYDNFGNPVAIDGNFDVEWNSVTIDNVADLSAIANDPMASAAMREAASELLMGIMSGMSLEDAQFLQAITMRVPIVVDPSGVTWMLDAATGTYVVVPPAEPLTTDEPVEVTAPLELTLAETMSHLPSGGMPPITATEPIPVTAPVSLTPLSMSFAEAIAGGADVATIIAENFVPLEEAWNTMFAPEGLMAVNFNTFSAGVALGWTNIDTAMNGYITNVNEDLPLTTSAITAAKDAQAPVLDAMIAKFDEAQESVQSLVDTINDLMTIEGSFSVEVTVTGGEMPVDGSHADGLASVPYNGYTAELHKGERVLTAEQNQAYNSGYSESQALLGGVGNTSTDNSNTVVNINGVQNVDKILFELKRRGIHI